MPGADGREIRVADGLIHHWFGSILFSQRRAWSSVLKWVKNYATSITAISRKSNKSKLLSRDGDTYTYIPPVRAQERSDRSLQHKPHGRLPASSARKGIELKFHDRDCRDSERRRRIRNREACRGRQRLNLWRLNSYWRFKEWDGGVVIEC